MRCERFEDLLALYVDGDLAAGDRALVESHLETCRECSTLLALLRETRSILAVFPEISPPPELGQSLAAIPERKTGFRVVLEAFRKPALQPILAAATVILTVLSLYLLNPERRQFDKTLVRTFHNGVSRAEKLYVQAGSLTDTLGSYANSVLASLQKAVPSDRSAERL